MIDFLGPHTNFIVSAYAGVTLVVFILIVWTWTASNRQKRRLADLEARGIRRRSDTAR